MSNYRGHILTDDIVVNYKNRDKDDCLHFLTHLDTSCHDLATFVSPTAKRIYTSIFNAWFLKINFNIKHIDVQGFDTNKSYKITYKGNKYIYSFIDSKFTTGSVALLLHGTFGTYLYTGNFCYYSSFVRSPVLLPVIEEKALTRLYLDNTYYEQPSNFLGFDEIASKVVELIMSEPTKNFYIYADKVTMDPLIAEIASNLEEKVYVCQSTMEIMKILGYGPFFTRHSNESRIFINKTIIKKRDFEQDNITVYLNRFSDPCQNFKKIEKKGNVYNFNFYCHCSHKEICELLRVLKPESMSFLFLEIDKAKLSKKPLISVEGAPSTVTKKTPGKSILSTFINGNTANVRRNSGSKTIIIPKNKDLINLNTNDRGKNLACSTSENQDVVHLHSTEHQCPLRILKVPELNNVGLPNKSDCTKEDDVSILNIVNYNNSNKTDNSNEKSHSSLESFHNYHKPKPEQSFKLIKIQGNNSTGNRLNPSNVKSLSSCIVQTKSGVPLVFNPRLVTENRLNGTNSKIMQISNVGVVSDGKKNTIVVKRKYVDVEKPCLITVPPDDAQTTPVNYVAEDEKHFITEKTLLKSKTCDTNSKMIQPPVLDGSKDNNPMSVLHNSFQIPENNIDALEESISVKYENCDSDSIELEVPRDNINEEDRDSDSLPDSINLHQHQPEHDINQACEMPAGCYLQSNQPNHNEKNTGNNSSVTKFVMNDIATNDNPCRPTNDLKLEPPDKNTEKNYENEFCEDNFQDATEDISNLVSKRCLSDDENEQSKKKLRSDNLRQDLSQSSCQQKEPPSSGDCSISVRRNGFERSYFYSSQHDCYLPKFCGFKKHEIRPRSMLIALRNLQKLLKN